MGQDELAPGVVGGLLVSYHLREELRGPYSTERGTTSGCEGSIMESYTGTTLGALWRPKGDEVLAPRVLAMAYLEKVEREWPEVRVGLGFKRRSSGNGALAWLNFRTTGRVFAGQMTGEKWKIAI